MGTLYIEEAWWSDARRIKLIALLGIEDVADGTAVKLFALAQHYISRGRPGIPAEVFKLSDGSLEMIESGLFLIKAGFAIPPDSDQIFSYERSDSDVLQ